MKLLAVDDDESILTVLEQALSCTGVHDVTTALSAREALEFIDRDGLDFDCLLIDIQMPEVDGIELTRVIRQTPGFERHPVLMLTAMHDRSYLDRAFLAGATDYVTKPFDFRNLHLRILDAQAMACEKSRASALFSGSRNIAWTRGIANDVRSGRIIVPENIDGLITYAEFDNYVLELARRRKCSAVVMALKMAAPALGHAETPMAEFTALLGQFVACARATLSPHLISLSYRGNGMLMCVLEQAPPVPQEIIESEINMRFADTSAQFGLPGIRLFVGEPAPIRTGAASEVFESQWEATGNVERRFAETKEMIVSRRLINQGLITEEQHRLNRKAYKSVMRDMLSDLEDEHWIGKLYRRKRQRNL